MVAADSCWIAGIVLPFGCPLGSEIHIWRSEITDGCDILVYWYGRKILHFTLLIVVAFFSSCILDHSFLSIQVDESRHLACLCCICIPSAYNSNWQCIVAEVTLNEFTLFACIILYCFKQISEDSHVALFFFLAIFKHFAKNLRTFSSVAILKWSIFKKFSLIEGYDPIYNLYSEFSYCPNNVLSAFFFFLSPKSSLESCILWSCLWSFLIWKFP